MPKSNDADKQAKKVTKSNDEFNFFKNYCKTKKIKLKNFQKVMTPIFITNFLATAIIA